MYANMVKRSACPHSYELQRMLDPITAVTAAAPRPFLPLHHSDLSTLKLDCSDELLLKQAKHLSVLFPPPGSEVEFIKESVTGYKYFTVLVTGPSVVRSVSGVKQRKHMYCLLFLSR